MKSRRLLPCGALFKTPVIAILLLCLGFTGIAQKNKTIIKTNLPGLAIKNYNVQVERLLKKKLSLSLGLRVMPETTIPFKDKIYKKFGDNDPDLKKTFDVLKLGNIALTPEMRIYFGKHGAGRGFYLSLFYRYANFKTNNLSLEVDTGGVAKDHVTLGGNLRTHTGGLMFGAQWKLGKSVVLDWWIIGVHAGSSDGNFTGTTRHTMNAAEQKDAKAALEKLDIPFTHKTVAVNSNSATLSLKGPWAGVRAGVALGIRL